MHLGRTLGLLLALAVLAGCSSRSIRAPITDLSEPSGQAAVIAQAGASAQATPSATPPAAAPAPKPAPAPAVTPSPTPATTPPAASTPPPAASAAAPAPTSSATPAPDKAATPAPAPEAAAATINWQWPHKGRIIRPFSAGGNGIDIEGDIGDPVLAAADGKVMYVGNGMRSMGNLLLLWHEGDYLSVYAHNEKLLVKMGDQIKQGQKIATLGQSEAASPRLHFEIRKSQQPIDPIPHLPPR